MTPNKSLSREIVLSLLLVALVVLFCNPFNLLMMPVMLVGISACLVVCFAVFATFIWQEQARDEREALQSMAAGRTAFLTGVGILVIGIVYEGWYHAVDPWLLLALGMMIMAKVISIVYWRYRG